MPAPPQPGVDFYGRDPWEAFSSNADGTNDYLTITPSITNAKSFHYRCWIHPKGDGTERVLVANDNAANVGIRIILTTTNQLQVILRNTSGTTILDATSLSNGYIDAMGMGTIDINVDLNATTYQMLWNGFDDSPITPATAPVNDTIDFGGNWAFWADPDGTQPFNGDVSQVFAIFGQTYIDLDTDSNWAKFVEDAALRPANMGYDFSRPYSAAPTFFLPMDSDDPGQNWGSESDLTENGAFTAGTVTPLNFVFRLPLTDFPGTDEAYVTATTNFDSTDGPTMMMIHAAEHDVTNGHYVMDVTRSNIQVLNPDILNFDIQKAAAPVALDLSYAGHASTGTKRLLVFSCDITNTGDFILYDNGVDAIDDLTINTETPGGNLDWTNAELKYGQLVTALLEANGGLGGFLTIKMAPSDVVIDDIWDSTNSVPKWPGRKGENWTSGNGQPLSFSVLPGNGLKRVVGVNKNQDMTEEGTAFPLLPRTSWFT